MIVKMLPKTSTSTTIVSLIALLSVCLIITQSSAQAPCKQFRTVSELLESYDIPAGLFPSDVKTFSCDALSGPGGDVAISLVIQLRSTCTVTREVAGVTNSVQYSKLIMATVYRNLITGVRGVVGGLFAPSSSPLGPINFLVTLDQVRVIVQSMDTKFVQFYDVTGFASPPIPIDSIPSQFPLCIPAPDLRKAAFDAFTGVSNRQQDEEDNNQRASQRNINSELNLVRIIMAAYYHLFLLLL